MLEYQKKYNALFKSVRRSFVKSFAGALIQTQKVCALCGKPRRPSWQRLRV